MASEPEQVIVLETVGAVKDVAKAASKIPGLEWLTELDLEEGDAGDGFKDTKDPTKKLPRRLYAVMSNQQAIDRLIGLWKNWHTKPNERAKPKFGPFKNVFVYLKDVRRWSVKDRIVETRVVEYWEEALEYEKGNIRFEVELWCRADPARRKAAYESLRRIIIAAGGQCISDALIREILYYGVLAELPALKVKETIKTITDESYTSLLRCEDVMFFRPHAQSIFPGHEPADDSETTPAAPKKAKKPKAAGDPVIALLDGLPLAHHNALDGGRLVIDDPDNHAALYKPRQQEHGTAMASLIVHGDLSVPGDPLPRPIYVRPIMRPYEDFNKNVEERTPHDRLLVDLIHRAVVGIKGTDTTTGAAPTVKVMNLSIGNSWQPFFRDLSPMARLLDWLAWKYKILFIVSVGNQSQPIEPAFTTTDIASLSDVEVRARTLEAIHKDQMCRRPFAPAEAMNVLTVGRSMRTGRDGPATSGWTCSGREVSKSDQHGRVRLQPLGQAGCPFPRRPATLPQRDFDKAAPAFHHRKVVQGSRPLRRHARGTSDGTGANHLQQGHEQRNRACDESGSPHLRAAAVAEN